MTFKLLLAAAGTALLASIPLRAWAQGETDEGSNDFKGMSFRSADSLFYINFRFRMQNRVGFTTRSGSDLGINQYEARVRRLRLRADGHVLTEKIGYSIQLSFSRSDQDFEDSGVPNLVRDAVIFYRFKPNFYLAFGLNKLPGNRQRVISSGQLQFADRSIVNSALTIDRDFGLKAYYDGKLGSTATYSLKGAITTGEGRSANTTDTGLAYTGRVELLPLGKFEEGGDYSEGDLAREETLKVSLAAGYSYNDRTTRTGGQVGESLYGAVSLGTFISDAMVKYRGWAYLGEYLHRRSPNPFTYNDANELSYAFVGSGLNQQLSYMFRNDWEPAFRYSWVRPGRALRPLLARAEVAELGLTRYLRGHRVKAQASVRYATAGGSWNEIESGTRWGGVFQFELGI